MPDLLLWDLDETLVTTAGAGERSIVRSAHKHWSVDVDLSLIPYAGCTDRRIGHLIRRHFGIGDDESILRAYLDDFVNFVSEELSQSDARILPGVSGIVEAVHISPDHEQGLLTGNLMAAAEAKLVPFGLWDYFSFGAFADDAIERLDLGPIALARASEYCASTFVREAVTVIGDTPHDIACARAIGARSLAVASGRFTMDQLAECEPTFLVDSLEEPAVLSFLSL
ncbi:MAG: HAD hydrolase-like protein [Opitutae bacterium]|nr:HAD hydrolase-like protein [Opitutae bacterium]